MTPREQDAYIATHLFNLSVLGWAYADNYDGCGWEGWTVHDEQNHSYPPKEHQPVFLYRCQCDAVAKQDARFNTENPELNWVEPKTFGHCSICLRVVPFYSQNHTDAFAMEEKIALNDWRGMYLEQLKKVVDVDNKGIPEWFLVHATPAQRAQTCVEMLVAIEIAQLGH